MFARLRGGEIDVLAGPLRIPDERFMVTARAIVTAPGVLKLGAGGQDADCNLPRSRVN